MTVAVLAVSALCYLVAVSAARGRGRGHSVGATLCFLAGLVVLGVALREHWGSYDDETPWVHDTQHALLMSIAPPLLALGAPITVAIKALPVGDARWLVGVLHSRPLRLLCGRSARVHAPIDYYGVMAVYLFTPAYALSRDNQTFHIATHVVFLVCGLMFWVPVIGRDPVEWRPNRAARLGLVGLGIPINAVLALLAGSWMLAATSEAATLFGLVIVALVPVRHVVRLPAVRQRSAIATPVVATPVART
jgi:putative membrane protein